MKIDLQEGLRKILSRVEKPESGCWLWTGATKNGHHGCIKLGGRKGPVLYNHRVVWEALHGPIPAGKIVMHKCAVPACVRPDHLELGTHSDNARHAVALGTLRPPKPKPGISGLVGVYPSTVTGHLYWVAKGRGETLYHGKDFFEACCARKSWERDHYGVEE